MALVLVDRVKVRTQTAGTGTLTLGPAVEGFQTFASVGNGNTTYYAIVDNRGNWEIGLGTYSSVTVDSVTTESLGRTTVYSSSNNGAKINFPTGAKNVFATYPAAAATTLFGGPGAAPSAVYANTISITADTTTNATNYPLFVNNTTGNLVTKVSTGFTYNPSTNSLAASTFVGNLTGNVTGNVTGNLTGNASGTAARLATPRNINGVAFDGSANITVTAAADTLSGTALKSTVITSSLTSVGTLTDLTVTNKITGRIQFSDSADAVQTSSTIDNTSYYLLFASSASGAQSLNTTSNLRYNPSTGEISSTKFIGPLTGNADTATTLQTSRTINGVSFNGSSDITVGMPARAYQKNADATGSGTVTFPATAVLSTGASFGSMAASGIFTFTRAGTYQVIVNYNVSADPDAWGGINGTTGTRYNQFKKNSTGAAIGSASDIITVNVNDTYEWKTNNLVVVYGNTASTATKIQFIQIG